MNSKQAIDAKDRIVAAINDAARHLGLSYLTYPEPTVTQEGEDSWTIVWGPGGIDVGHEFEYEAHSLDGKRKVKAIGFRSWRGRIEMATRWHPEDHWDETVEETTAAWQAAKSLIRLACEDIIDEAMMTAFPPYDYEEVNHAKE